MTFNELIIEVNAQLTAFANQVGEDVVADNLTDVVKFSNGTGNYINTPLNPWTSSAIPISTVGIVRGGFVVIWYKGSILSKANITGGTITMFSGVNNLNELCRVVIDCDMASGAFSVNIQTGFTGDIPTEPIGVPAQMTITALENSTVQNPAQMTITEVATAT